MRHYVRDTAVIFRTVSLRAYSQSSLSQGGRGLNCRAQSRQKNASFQALGPQTRPACCDIYSSLPVTVGRTGYGYRLASTSAMVTGQSTHRAFVALGSNMGDRVAMIEEACREMEVRGIKIKRTSSLFETAPMYVMDQGTFLNGACEARILSHFVGAVSSNARIG